MTQDTTNFDERTERFLSLAPKLFDMAEERYGRDTRTFLEQTLSSDHAGDYLGVLHESSKGWIVGHEDYSDNELIWLVFDHLESHAVEYGIHHEVKQSAGE